MDINFDEEEEYDLEYEDDMEIDGDIVVLTDEEETRIHEKATSSHRGPLGRTCYLGKKLDALSDEEKAISLKACIDKMAEMGWDVVLLLHYLSWNLDIPPHLVGTQSTIRYARTALMVSPLLSGILSHWLKPPRRHAKGISTKGAKVTLEKWAIDNYKCRVSQEMNSVSPIFYSTPGHVSEEMLLGAHLKQDIVKTKEQMPVFWDSMTFLTRTPRQIQQSKCKDYEPRIFMIIAVMLYNRSQVYCRYQKVLTIYLKSAGLGSKATDTTHLFGLTMSVSWMHNAIISLSDSNSERMREDIMQYIFFGGHDNMNLPFRVYEMRVSNQSHFDSGTTGTIYIVKDPAAQRPSRLEYQKQRAIGCKNPIRARDIIKREVTATPRLNEQSVWIVKQFLLMHPAFTAFEAQNADHPLFQPPPPVSQLPTGPEHATQQHMLRTVHIEESSQEGNRKCLDEWRLQLHLDGIHGQNDSDPNRLVIWIGDQLTTIRIRFLKRDRSQDFNYQQRFDDFEPHPGLFHTQLSEEYSLHKQYYGTNTSFGFKHAFINMKRKGLDRPTTQGNFHYGFRDALKHTAEARFRDLWMVVSGVKKFEELAERTPEELDALARKIVREYASTLALEDLRDLGRSEGDERLEHSIMFCRDLLNYLCFDGAIKSGDVGLIELYLPRLLFRFHGTGSHNYSHEILELMQSMWREWPDDLKTFIMRFCWLANTTGHENSFLPFDMVQEHNVRDLKVTFAIHGPYASWDYIKRISASIPTQRKLKDHIEREFNYFRRGKSHSSPDHEEDVENLRKLYAAGKVHVHKRGRTIQDGDKAKDFLKQGSNAETLQSMITRWANGRMTERATSENFESAESALQRLRERYENQPEAGPEAGPSIVAVD